MATTTLNTRIQLKYDSYQNWWDHNPTPNKGEVCIVVIPADTNAVVQEPAILMKVGDGEKAFRALDWVGAMAADVHSWAKAETKPTYAATEITGIGNYIAQYVDETLGISVDTDTQYRITKVDDYNYKLQSKAKGEADTAFADVGSIVIPKYDDTQIKKDIKDNKDAIDLLNGSASTAGSIAKAIGDAIAALQGNTTSTVKDAMDAAGGALAEAQKKVASVTAGDNSVTIGGTATAPTVAAKISQDANNALELASDGLKVVIPDAAEYSIVKDSNSGDYAAVYHLTKDGTNVGTAINIPKDMVVSEGSVVTNPSGQPAGTYIKLVLQNVTNPLYINVGSLIEYVTSGSQTGDMVVVSVSDDHKVTATITDGTITLAKLDSDTQAKINKAHEHSNKSVLDGIDANKVSAWDSAEQNAKDHADCLNTAMDNRVKELEKIDHDHTNKTVLDGITSDKVTAWDKVSEKANDADLKAIAKSGNVNDLIQTTGDVLILDCGDSNI